MSRDVFILGGKRTAMGEYVGALKDISAIDLGATAARGAMSATGVAADEIDHTIVGNALQTSGDAIYSARHVALKAGVPFDRPALTSQPPLRQWMAWRVALPIMYKIRPSYDLSTFTYEGFLEELLHRYRARHRFAD